MAITEQVKQTDATELIVQDYVNTLLCSCQHALVLMFLSSNDNTVIILH